MGHIVPASTDISMAPPDALPLHDHEVLDSNLSGNHFAYNLLKLVLIVLSSFVDTPRYSSGGDDLNDSILSQTFKKENTRLQIENGDLRAEKQRIKNESYELDGQLITALEQLSAYQQQQGLMQERYTSLEKEARKMNETNQEMKLKIEAYVYQAARDHETMKQQQVDLAQGSENFKRLCQEKDGLRERCNSLEQNRKEIQRQGQPDEWKREWQRGQERDKQLENIMQENINRLQDEDIPSLLKDNEELKQQLAVSNQLHQEELRLARQEQDALKYENERLKNKIYSDGIKPIDQIAGAENGGRDMILQMDQLSLHFEECSRSLRKLIQLLEANVEAKDCQLDRRSQELRDARMKNDKLVQEVISRGHDVSRLTSRLQQVNEQNSPQTRPSDSTLSSSEFATADFETPVKYTLQHATDLFKYQPVIKSLYHGLEDVTCEMLDFNNTPVQVVKMVYLEDPKTHTGNQVICMQHGNYFFGVIKVVFNFRPVPQGIGALSPIAFVGIEFSQPVGQSDGSFQGVQYFETAPKCAVFITSENVYIHV